jgi:hypothetical protein
VLRRRCSFFRSVESAEAEAVVASLDAKRAVCIQRGVELQDGQAAHTAGDTQTRKRLAEEME